ncbi:MAG: AAA family ATPase [Candidatus Nanohaloarchaea archaeon]
MKDFSQLSREELDEQTDFYGEKLQKLGEEIQKTIIGQEEAVDSVLTCLVADGNALLEGVPGLGKSLLVETLGRIVEDSGFNRIQFTPDLLPADIVGIEAYDEDKGFYTEKGPIFSNFILADEINRAPPKVQSAMLEAMQENKVTIGDEDYQLPKPFFVLATQNPVEQEGTYPLPEAQVDRFLFKIVMDYPKRKNEFEIIDVNAERMDMNEYGLNQVITSEELIEAQELSKEIIVSDEIKKYILDLVEATRNPEEFDLEYGDLIDYGGSPRASINLALAARANALINKRFFVKPDDVREVVHEVFRHRIILNYEGQARDISKEEIIDDIVDRVPVR